jgi:hypothetical protein
VPLPALAGSLAAAVSTDGNKFEKTGVKLMLSTGMA